MPASWVLDLPDVNHPSEECPCGHDNLLRSQVFSLFGLHSFYLHFILINFKILNTELVIFLPQAFDL